MDQILKDFGVQPLSLVAQVVNFLILLYLLKRFLYKPILKVLDQRKEIITKGLKNAEEIEIKLQKTEEIREKKLLLASKEAKSIIDEASKSAELIIQEAHIKAARDLKVIFAKGEETLRMERDKMQQEIKEDLSKIVILAMEKVSGKILDKKDQKDLVERSIKNL